VKTFPEFGKLPEIQIREGKDASAIKRLAIDLVRFPKISTFCAVTVSEMRVIFSAPFGWQRR